MRIHITNKASSNLKVFGKEVRRGANERFTVKNDGIVNIYSDTGRCTIRIYDTEKFRANCKGKMDVHLTYNQRSGYFYAKVTD